MAEPLFFAAPWDQKLTTLTIVFSAILVGSAALLVLLTLRLAPPVLARFALFGAAGVSLTALILAAALAPRGYSVTDETLRVERWLRPVEIPLQTIRSVESVSPERLRNTLRTLGSGGLFGYYGRFHSPALGSFRMYATRGEDYVLITGRRQYVLTPATPERFIQALNEQRNRRSSP